MTFQVADWIDKITCQVYREIVVEKLQYASERKNLDIYAFGIMSNHIHTIVQSNTGKVSDTIQDIKKFTSKRIIEIIQSISESRRKWMLNRFSFNARQHSRNKTYQVWKHENNAIYPFGHKFIREKIDYLHNNPVRAGLVEKP